MKLILKDYKFSKLKGYLKKNSILFIYNSKIKKQFIQNIQKFKKNNVKSYYVSNSLMKKCLSNSIYYNYTFLVSGLVLFQEITEKSNLKKLNKQDILLGIKLNNKIYIATNPILQKNIKLNYKNEITNLLNTFKKSTKLLKSFSK